MQKIKLITDSACDIPLGKEKALNIKILCFPITIAGKNYRERIDFTPQEFYEILKREEKTPTTSQITPFEFIQTYEELYEEGYEELIYVSINANGSATNANAILARESFFEDHPERRDKFKIHIIDSGTYSIQYGFAVMNAAKMAQENKPASVIIESIKDFIKNSRIYCTAYSLAFAKKSGRVSSVAAFMGELLGIRPIITFEDGISKVVGKMRGDNHIMAGLIDKASERRIENTPYIIGGSSFSKERQTQFAAKCKEAFGSLPMEIFYLGAAVSINLGPEAIGIIVREDRSD